MTLCYDLCIDIGLVGTFSMEISIFAICEGSFPALINIGHFGLIHQLSTNDQAADWYKMGELTRVHPLRPATASA